MIAIRTLLKEDHFLGKHDQAIERDCPECQEICCHELSPVVVDALPAFNEPTEEITVYICGKCGISLSKSEGEAFNGHS
jgi:hypothetical protein